MARSGGWALGAGRVGRPVILAIVVVVAGDRIRHPTQRRRDVAEAELPGLVSAVLVPQRKDVRFLGNAAGREAAGEIDPRADGQVVHAAELRVVRHADVVAGAGRAVEIQAAADRRGRISLGGHVRHRVGAVERACVSIAAYVGEGRARAAAVAVKGPVGQQAAGGVAEVIVEIAGRGTVGGVVLRRRSAAGPMRQSAAAARAARKTSLWGEFIELCPFNNGQKNTARPAESAPSAHPLETEGVPASTPSLP